MRLRQGIRDLDFIFGLLVVSSKIVEVIVFLRKVDQMILKVLIFIFNNFSDFNYLEEIILSLILSQKLLIKV